MAGLNNFDIGILTAIESERKGVEECLRKDCRTYVYSTGYSSLDFKGIKVLVLKTGVGRKAVKKNLSSALMRFAFKFIISTGFSGALNIKLKVGDICIPRLIIKHGARYDKLTIDSPVLEYLDQVGFNGSVYKEVTSLTVDRIYNYEDKKNVTKDYNASILDMESYIIGKILQTRNIPFISIRVVLDTYDFSFPDMGFFIRRKGHIDYSLLARQLLYNPSDLLSMLKMWIYSKKASRQSGLFVFSLITYLKEKGYIDKMINTK